MPGRSKYNTEPIYPNQILQNKSQKFFRDIHEEKKKAAKSVIDTRAPKRYKHLKLRLKKAQMKAESEQKIQFENLILVDKLRHILVNKQVDNENHREPKSLNRIYRTKELTKIVAANERILERITKVGP